MTELNAILLRQLKGGEKVNLYVTGVPEHILREHGRIDHYDPTTGKGYQRRTTESRAVAIARFVLQQEGILPTAILVNIRSPEAKFTPTPGLPKADGQVVVGNLLIPDDEPWWIVDGQNRMHGLHKAAEQKAGGTGFAKLDYDIPVVFTLDFDELDEMRTFFVVNNYSKSVPTDLSATLIRQAIQNEGLGYIHSRKGTEKELRKAAGTAIAEYLNANPGPWHDKIRLPNEVVSKKKKPLQVNGIASSLEHFLRWPLAQSYLKQEVSTNWPTLSGLVMNYWTALAELMPEAFSDIENYSVQRTTGTYTFNMVMPQVLEVCTDRNDYSVSTFRAILSSLGEWVQSETWNVEDGEVITRSTGMSSLRALADKMIEMLPKVSLPGLKAKPAAAPPVAELMKVRGAA